MGYEYEDHWGKDYYRYTCDECGWYTIVPEGTDVAFCPQCETAEPVAV